MRLARRPRRDERAWYATGTTTSGAAVDGAAVLVRKRVTPSPRVDATDADQPTGWGATRAILVPTLPFLQSRC